LARAQRETLRAIPLPDGPHAPEIRTLGDAAVSRSASAQTVRGRLPPKIALLLASVLALVVGGLYVLRPSGRKSAPVREAIVAPTVPKAIPPAPPAEPSRVEMGLDSVPTGAEVFVGDVLLGKTPTRYQSPPTTTPVEFVFRLPGYQPERVSALPARGLTVSAKFSTPTPAPAPAKRQLPDRPKRTQKLRDVPSVDIQTER